MPCDAPCEGSRTLLETSLFCPERVRLAPTCSVRLGEIVKKVGGFLSNNWEVAVDLDPSGRPGATRAEEGINLPKPTPSGLAKMGIAAVVKGNASRAPPPPPTPAPKAAAGAPPPAANRSWHSACAAGPAGAAGAKGPDGPTGAPAFRRRAVRPHRVWRRGATAKATAANAACETGGPGRRQAGCRPGCRGGARR